MTTIDRSRPPHSTELPDGLFAIPTNIPGLMQSQVKALSGRIPLLYFIVFVNTAAVAWTHYGIAPDFLTIGFPALVLIAGLMRARPWVKSRGRAISDADARGLLNATVIVAGVFGAMFLAWGLALYQYGDAYAQGHVVFYMAITVISGIFCLMHLRSAALVLTGVTVVPFSIFFLATGHPVFIAIAINTLLVSAVMVYVLLTYSRDFATIVAFQKALVETHKAETERVRSATEIERAAQREILKHAGRFEVALNNMQQGLCMFDVDDRLIVCNQRYARMYELPDELTQPGARWRDIVAHRVKTFGYRDLGYDDVLAQHRAIDLTKNETTATRLLGDGRIILVRHRPIKEGGWVATHEDITERSKTQAQLSHLAHHDALTGLANRHLLQERMERAVAGLQRGEAFAILCIGLNHIKSANDALGHAVGDALLREVAARLSACVLEGDTVARIGGSEFAVLQVGIAGPDEPVNRAQTLLDVLTRPYEIEGHQIIIDANVGLALAPRDETAGPPLLRQADIALSRAKAEGGKTWRAFEAAMDAELQNRRGLEIDLRRALANNEFEVHFQPINSAKTRSVRSFEALARWRHPERGMISPADFIPLAERTGLIAPLGEWVLRTACQEATHWPSDVRVSVNLSACQFRAGDLIGMVRKALADTGLPARRLELEITESVLLDGSGDNLATLHALRDLGAKIAMDDFGTGYSSLSYLRSFPFDKIKIDQSFVKNIDQRDAREIVRAIANLGRTLGITTTAEGVETEEQLKTMIAYRCTEVQGYLFSRPVPASQVRRLLDMFYQARQAA
jgi:diguanylate cyclase (GGDEF)-like protein